MTEKNDSANRPEAILEIVLAEMRQFRQENADQHHQILSMMDARNNNQDKRMNGLEARTRALENWRAYLLGIGAAIAVGISWLVNRITAK